MTGKVNEQLSALMDGELAPDQVRFVLAGLAARPGAELDWERWHVARGVLRKQPVPVLDAGFAAAVAARIAAEAAPRRRVGSWLRWGAGGVVAASVAVAALVFAPQPQRGPAGFQAGTPAGPAMADTPAHPARVPSRSAGFRPPMLAPPVEVAPVNYDIRSVRALDGPTPVWLLPPRDAGAHGGVPFVLKGAVQPVEQGVRVESGRH